MRKINNHKKRNMIWAIVLITMITLPIYQLEMGKKYSRFDNLASITRERKEQNFTVNNLIALYYCGDVFVEGTNAYFVTNEGFMITDVCGPKQPEMVCQYAGSTGMPSRIFVSEEFVFLATYYYKHGMGLEIIDASDTANLATIGHFIPEENEGHYYIKRIFVEGEYAYLLGYNDAIGDVCNGSLVIIDCSDPTKPKKVGRYLNNESTFVDLFAKDQFIYLLIDDGYRALGSNEGLVIIDATNATTPYKVGEWISDSGYLKAVFFEKNHVFIVNQDKGLSIIDVGNPMNPQKVSEYVGEWFQDVFVSGSYAYIAYTNGLYILDISKIERVRKRGRFNYNNEHGAFRYVFIENNFAYMMKDSEDLDRMFFIIDCSNPARPRRMSPSWKAPEWLQILPMFLLSLSAWIGIPVVLVSAIIFTIFAVKRLRRKKEDRKDMASLNVKGAIQNSK